MVAEELVFDHERVIQREVVWRVSQNLVGPPGTSVGDVRGVLSFPDAAAQCKAWLKGELPAAPVVAANSTAEAAKLVGEGAVEPGTAAIGPALPAKVYRLDVLPTRIEDHPDNETRFVLVGREGIPAPTGHDKTSIVCFQHVDRPGSLHAILGQFSARNLNLTKLASRPTKRGLGHYCFIIDFEGHVADE